MGEKKDNDYKIRYDELLKNIQNEIQGAHNQVSNRQKLITELEKELGSKLMIYVSKLEYTIDHNDIHMFGSMLDSIGETDNIDLLIQSPGGNGNVAEKIVEMIRSYAKKRFRVIVPNHAKSAATMIALASDQIFMGVSSELGPIDSQMRIVQGGVNHFVSAQSFIDARDTLEKKANEAIKNKEPYQAYIAQLTTLDSGFIEHCEKSMDFAKDFAEKYLAEFMLKNKKNNKELAKGVASDLCSTSEYFTHGRTISANTIKSKKPLKEINLKELDKDSKLWKMIFQLYLRSELFLDLDNPDNQVKGKLYETSSFSMKAHFPKR